MLKKIKPIYAWWLIIVILGAGIWVYDAISQTKGSSTWSYKELTAKELKEELQKKELKISLIEAINIAEKKYGGKVISCRLRFLGSNNKDLGYSITLFHPDKPSIEYVVIHGVTGDILLSQETETCKMQTSTTKPSNK